MIDRFMVLHVCGPADMYRYGTSHSAYQFTVCFASSMNRVLAHSAVLQDLLLLRFCLFVAWVKTLQAFIKANLWDEARIFSSEMNLSKGIQKPKINGTLVTKKRIESDTLKTFMND